MSYSDTDFLEPVKDQSIIHFTGQLDRLASQQLWSSIEHKLAGGASAIFIDMSACGVVLTEGITELRALWQQGRPQMTRRVAIGNLTESAMLAFQMAGVLLQNRQAIFKIAPETQTMANQTKPDLIHCPRCCATLRIQQSGAHICPKCKTTIPA